MDTRRLRDSLNTHINLPLTKKADQVIRSLSPGDKVVFFILIFFMTLGAFFALGQVRDQIVDVVPAHGGSLTEGVVGSPRFVNPLLALSDADRDLVELTFAGLMTTDADGNLIPELAEDYEVSEDGRTYTFRIRSNAVFHDGTPVTASDVAFTVSKVQDPLIKSPRLANWVGVRTEVLDPRTIIFTLSEPYAPFLENATLGILPEHIWKDVPSEEFPFSQFVVEPIGAGPYEVVNVKRNNSGILREYKLRASDTYVLGKPYITTITLKFYGSERDVTRALSRGEVESAHSLIPESLDENHRIVTKPYLRIFGVFLNQNENQILANQSVRQALSLAIDRNRIITQVLAGYGTPLVGPLPQSVHETGTPDVEGAIALLERRGWEFDLEERVWKNDGDTISLTLRTGNVPELAQTAQIIKQNLEAIGVPVSLELYDQGELSQGVIRPRDYEALLFGMVLGRVPDLYAFWHSSQRNDPGLNVALYANVDVDRALEELRESTDQDTRERYENVFLREITTDIPALFTHAPELPYVVPSDVGNVSFPPITTPSDRFSTVHTWYRETEKVWPFLVQQ